MRIIVYGATGFTGRLVCHALRGRGLDLVAAGRNRTALDVLASELGGVETRAAPLNEPERLYPALADADVVVSCAGPFATFGEPVLRAALRVGAHYLDTTGEQVFMRDIYERYEAEARRKDVCVVNGMAFEIALGDWAAAIAAAALGPGSIDEVAVGYAVENFAPTRGTALSAVEMLGARGYVWDEDRWDEAGPGALSRSFSFPDPFGHRQVTSFPSGEVISVPRHVPTRSVRAFLSLNTALGGLVPKALPIVAPLLGAAVRSPLGKLIRKRIAAGPPGPTDGQRAVNDFCVQAEARRDAEVASVAACGADIYGVSAQIVAWGVEELIGRGPLATGVVAPAEAFEPESSLREVARRCDLRLSSSFDWSGTVAG